MNNNPISFSDPEGDIAPLILAGIAIAGGAINLASNWSHVNSFMEGLNYFATGAAGYAVGTVNPVAGGLILAGGNLSVRALNGDLPQLNSFGDFAMATATVGLDFLGPYAAGTTITSGWSSFKPTGYLSQTELTQLANAGIRPSITQVAGTGLRKTVTEQVVKNTVAQTTNQVVQHSSKRLAKNLINAGIQRPLNSAAHHIVAGGSKNRFAQASRDILNRAGVGIDDAANGTFLPRNANFPNPPASFHSRIHTNLYYENVYRRLSSVPLNEVPNQLKYIGNQLLNGTFPF